MLKTLELNDAREGQESWAALPEWAVNPLPQGHGHCDLQAPRKRQRPRAEGKGEQGHGDVCEQRPDHAARCVPLPGRRRTSDVAVDIRRLCGSLRLEQDSPPSWVRQLGI